ncbi:MAG: hypothetical protein GYB67_01290 [Chloroflexi bacterium]|nr:hypothetical protein [Chloroflexota bacterium]
MTDQPNDMPEHEPWDDDDFTEPIDEPLPPLPDSAGRNDNPSRVGPFDSHLMEAGYSYCRADFQYDPGDALRYRMVIIETYDPESYDRDARENVARGEANRIRDDLIAAGWERTDTISSAEGATDYFRRRT